MRSGCRRDEGRKLGCGWEGLSRQHAFSCFLWRKEELEGRRKVFVAPVRSSEILCRRQKCFLRLLNAST